jgi:hypothetical protein
MNAGSTERQRVSGMNTSPQHTHQYREVTVDMTGQVFADQTEGKRLDQRDKK